MTWASLTNESSEHTPRLLTKEELDYVVSHLPIIPSADGKSGDLARNEIMAYLRKKIASLELDPRQIPALIDTIIARHMQALVEPGSSVGIYAAEAFGAPLTQMTLNTFHASGSAKSASFGISAMKDLISARKTPTRNICKVYFTNKLITFEEVLNMRQVLVGSSVEDFVTDYDIRPIDEFQKFWWHQGIDLLLRKELPPSKMIMRLTMDKIKMYKHRVTMKNIADALERENPPTVMAVYGPFDSGIMDIYPIIENLQTVVKSRTGDKKVVFHPDYIDQVYLEDIVKPELKNVRVKGIFGITALEPVIRPVLSMIVSEIKIDPESVNSELFAVLEPYFGSAWFLNYNHLIIRNDGIIPGNVAALCQAAGILVIGADSDRMAISLPEDRFIESTPEQFLSNLGDISLVWRNIEVNKTKVSDFPTKSPRIIKQLDWTIVYDSEARPDAIMELCISSGIIILETGLNTIFIRLPESSIKEMGPSEYINRKIAIDSKIYQEMVDRITDENALSELVKTPLLQASEFIYAITEGSELKSILAYPGIDKTKTISSNMYQVASTLGIEACRTFLIKEFYDTITNTGSYVHPSHIMLIAEFITSRGNPYGATYLGISRQPGGHLSLATLERAAKVLTTAASYGRKEDIRGVSASVTVGARMVIGSGGMDVAYDIVENGVPKILLNEELFEGFKKNDGYVDLTENGSVYVGGDDEYIQPADAQIDDVYTPNETINRIGELPGGVELSVEETKRIVPFGRDFESVDILDTIKTGKVETPVIEPFVDVEPLAIISKALIIKKRPEIIVPSLNMSTSFVDYLDQFINKSRVTPTKEVVSSLPVVKMAPLPGAEEVDFDLPTIVVGKGKRPKKGVVKAVDLNKLAKAL